MGARHVTTTETIAINDLLKLHTKTIGDGLVEYKEGYDDSRIAAMVATDLSANSVMRIRQELHGRLFVRGSGQESRIKVLEIQLSELTGKYNKLVETLALNKVADVRHLKLKLDDEPTLTVVKATG